MSACSFGCSCYCRICSDLRTYSGTGVLRGLYTGVCRECGDPGDWSPWFPVLGLDLLFLQAWHWSACWSQVWCFQKAMVFPLPWRFWWLVASVGVMKEFVFPSCPMLTMSRGFVVGPGQLSGIAFITNAGDVGLSCLPQSRQSVTVVAVLAKEAVSGTDWAVCVVMVSILANGGSGPDGESYCHDIVCFPLCCFCNLVCLCGLVINWFTGLVVGVG